MSEGEEQAAATPEEKLKILEAKFEELNSELRVAKFTIEQLEAENKTLSTINPAASTGGKKHKRKKKKKGKKKGGKGGKGAASDAAADEDEDDEEELTYDEIARRIPQLKLSTLLAAEKQFLEADADHSGHIDAGELDAMLTKHDQIFTKAQVQDIIKELDADGDEELDFFEYLTILHALMDPSAMEERKGRLSKRTSAALMSVSRSVRKEGGDDNSSSTCSVQ